jgi:CheY-like chemotaxis protein
MRRILLVHRNKNEAAGRIELLEAAGYDVLHEARVGPGTLRSIRDDPPAAIVVDLSRSPSEGRDFGLAVRHHKATRRVPLVFVGGEAEKVACLRALLPDAVYTPWTRIRSSLRRAIAHPPKDPVAARSLLAGYEGTPLPKKLGIKRGSSVALAGAPAGFEEKLGRLPEGATMRRQVRGTSDLIIWFTKSRRDLERRIDRMGEAIADGGSLWIAWPKRASGVRTDITQNDVRAVGLASGLVDYKICSIDDTWSGLRFARRKRK